MLPALVLQFSHLFDFMTPLDFLEKLGLGDIAEVLAEKGIDENSPPQWLYAEAYLLYADAADAAKERGEKAEALRFYDRAREMSATLDHRRGLGQKHAATISMENAINELNSLHCGA